MSICVSVGVRLKNGERTAQIDREERVRDAQSQDGCGQAKDKQKISEFPVLFLLLKTTMVFMFGISFDFDKYNSVLVTLKTPWKINGDTARTARAATIKHNKYSTKS